MSFRTALKPLVKSTHLSNGVRIVTEQAPVAQAAKTAAVTVMFDGGSRREAVPGAASAFVQTIANKNGVIGEVDADFASLSLQTTTDKGALDATPVLSILDSLDEVQASPFVFEGGANAEQEVMRRLHQEGFEGKLGYAQPSAEQLAAVTPAALKQHAELMTSKNTTVVAVGDVDHDALVEQCEKHLAKLEDKGAMFTVSAREDFLGQHLWQRHDNWPFVHTAVAFATDGYENEEQQAALEVFSQLVGQYAAKDRLVNMVDHRPLMRATAAFETAELFKPVHTTGFGHGLFGVYAVVQPTSLHNMLADSMRFLAGTVTQTTYGSKQFEWLKTAAATQRVAKQSTPLARAQQLSKLLLTTNRVQTLEDQIEQINDITPDKLMDAASDVIYSREHALVAYGNAHELPDVNWMRFHSEGKLA